MPSRKHTPEEITGKLREVNIVLAQAGRRPRRVAGSRSPNKPIIGGARRSGGLKTD